MAACLGGRLKIGYGGAGNDGCHCIYVKILRGGGGGEEEGGGEGENDYCMMVL